MEVNFGVVTVVSILFAWIAYLRFVYRYLDEKKFPNLYVVNTIITGLLLTVYAFYFVGFFVLGAGEGSVLLGIFSVYFDASIELFWSILLSFLMLVGLWHGLFRTFPCIPRWVCQMCKAGDDGKNFPELIDYLYYPVGAAFAASLIFGTGTGNDLGDIFLTVEVLVFLLLLSLKTTKVSIKLYGLGSSPKTVDTSIVKLGRSGS